MIIMKNDRKYERMNDNNEISNKWKKIIMKIMILIMKKNNN